MSKKVGLLTTLLLITSFISLFMAGCVSTSRVDTLENKLEKMYDRELVHLEITAKDAESLKKIETNFRLLFIFQPEAHLETRVQIAEDKLLMLVRGRRHFINAYISGLNNDGLVTKTRVIE